MFSDWQRWQLYGVVVATPSPESRSSQGLSGDAASDMAAILRYQRRISIRPLPPPRRGGRAGTTGWSQRPGQLRYQLLMFAIEDFSSKTGMTAIARSLSGRRVDHFSLNRARRSAGRRTIHAGSAYRYFYDAALSRSIQEALLDVVNVDLHPAVPWRGTVPGRLPYTDIDKPPLRALAAHLIAEEFRTRYDANGEIKYQRLAFYGAFGIERLAICCLKAVKHTNDRLFDHDPDFNLSLICACQSIPSTALALNRDDLPGCGAATSFTRSNFTRSKFLRCGRHASALPRCYQFGSLFMLRVCRAGNL